MKCYVLYQDLKDKENDELDIQLKVFDENKEDDLTELSHRLSDIRAEMEYPFDKPEKALCAYGGGGVCGWCGGISSRILVGQLHL